MQLNFPVDLKLSSSTAHLARIVSTELSESDAMYHGNDRHYLSCGASAMNAILSAIHLANSPDPSAILDFGAGAGRVTRWLRAGFQQATIYAADIREQDMIFCQQTFGARTWISGLDIDGLSSPATYDLIWVGSVATHFSSARTVRMLSKLLAWTRPGGLVVMSFHGRYAFERQERGDFRYIDDAGWAVLKAEYEATGYGYADYEHQREYGISMTKPSWLARLIEGRSDMDLVTLSERAWDDHHDIVAIRSRSNLN